MAIQKHLNRAPITEALIDIRATPSEPKPGDILSRLVKAVSTEYPHVQEHRGYKISFEFTGEGPGQASGTDTSQNGYLCRSADGKSIVQFSNDGFTFNRLPPYTSWDEILPEAMRLWALYSDAMTPQIFRIAVRYINQLEIPASGLRLAEYLTMPPSAPVEEGQEVTAFFSRVVVRDRRRGATASVVQARDPSLSSNSDVLILDIDAFKGGRGERLTNVDVEPTLKDLRAMKNSLFFGSLEESALERYL